VTLTDEQFRQLTETRVSKPHKIAEALASRRRRNTLTQDGMLFIVAADHTARAMVGLYDDPLAMANRRSMLDRLLTALEHPRVDGVLCSAEIIDDLALVDALHDKVAVGTMNRGGLAGASWTIDDRFTAYDTAHLRAANLDAGKLLLRIDYNDAGTVPTLESAARAVQELNDAQMMAMVEPIPYTKNAKGEAVWDTNPLALVKAVGVSAALGGSSAYTWLKIQATADIATVAQVTTQPLLLLGGAPGPDPEATFALWEEALHQPTVRGLVIGRSLLYPATGDVAGAVARAADLVQRAAKDRQ
jgi:DhnA family fructose-bisphosphate aldolase class Ia